ncbi:hypothetical protein V8C86DRAFT_2482751 [Haematococcus lacustris]
MQPVANSSSPRASTWGGQHTTSSRTTSPAPTSTVQPLEQQTCASTTNKKQGSRDPGSRELRQCENHTVDASTVHGEGSAAQGEGSAAQVAGQACTQGGWQQQAAAQSACPAQAQAPGQTQQRPGREEPTPSPPPPATPQQAQSDARAQRRAALLAAAREADLREEEVEAGRVKAAAVAEAGCGVSKNEGRTWLEAAKQGDCGRLAAMLASNPRLLSYQVRLPC